MNMFELLIGPFETPPPLQPVSCVTPITAAIITRVNARMRRFFQPRKQTATARVAPAGRNGLEPCWRAALPLSEMVSVVVTGAFPLGVTVDGLKPQETPVGGLMHANEIAVLKPPTPVRVKTTVAGWLGVTFTVDALSDMVKVGGTVVTV